MIMSGRGVGVGGGCRFPFTASQWQELEHQALIFKYIVSGVPIPSDLIFTIRRSFMDSSNFLFPHSSSTSPHIGWSCFQMGLGLGRKIDPEPGRCRRTDGKKWRCSKEAFQDSKYCEKHMHRGKNRSRKPVEHLHQALTTTTTTPSSMVKPTTLSSSFSSSLTSDNHHQNSHHLYPPSYYGNTHPYSHSKFVDSTTQLGLHSGAHQRVVDQNNEHSLLNEDSWQLSRLKMSNANGVRMSTKHHQQEYPPYYQFQGFEDYETSRTCQDDDDTRREKTVYRFLEECPPDNNSIKDSPSWLNLDDNKSSNCSSSSTTQLSISIPTTTTTTSTTSYHHQHHNLFPIYNSRNQNGNNTHF